MLARLFETVLWYETGLFATQLVDPVTLSYRRLKTILECRGLGYSGLPEKKDVSDLVEKSGKAWATTTPHIWDESKWFYTDGSGFGRRTWQKCNIMFTSMFNYCIIPWNSLTWVNFVVHIAVNFCLLFANANLEIDSCSCRAFDSEDFAHVLFVLCYLLGECSPQLLLFLSFILYLFLYYSLQSLGPISFLNVSPR